MSKIGVTCLLTLGQLEFIQKWIRNILMKKKEKCRRPGGEKKSKLYFISYGWKQITSICDNTLHRGDFRHIFTCIPVLINQSAFFFLKFEVIERTCNFKLPSNSAASALSFRFLVVSEVAVEHTFSTGKWASLTSYARRPSNWKTKSEYVLCVLRTEMMP